jgi:hypothetical protein
MPYSKPLKPHPIKVANTAPSDTTRANETAIKTAKTSGVTVVVAVMSIFCKKCNSQGAHSGDKKLSPQKAEKTDFLEENSAEHSLTHWIGWKCCN